MSWLVHGVRFACEIAAIVAFVWWGWPVVGIVAGAVVIAVWGAFVAPKATRRLADPARAALELVIFGAATAAFVLVGQTLLAIVFAAAAA
ncbi:MAG TPA: YrdB family protein, partial [Gaiellaceae bacterium]|nr:YrdB family protein [Gaiellaceae bacterium]